jgi:NADH-quinone oxidoreductase subunit J
MSGGILPGVAPLLGAIDWHTVMFLLFAIAACGCAVAVVAADNVVRMAFYLVLSLGAAAGLFFLAGAEFAGAMQLMIYVGGTLVLLVFGVMLTAQAPFVSIKTAAGDRVLAGIVGASLLAVLLLAAWSMPEWRKPGAGIVPEPTATPLGLAMVGVRVDEPPAGAPAGRRAGYLLPFEIVSVHLLVVLVAAAYLARAKRRKTPRAIEVAASIRPPESVAEHESIGRAAGVAPAGAGRSASVLSGGSASVLPGGSASVLSGGSASVLSGGSASVLPGGSASVLVGEES